MYISCEVYNTLKTVEYLREFVCFLVCSHAGTERDKTMADKLKYISDMMHKLTPSVVKISGWNVWTLNLMGQPIKTH